MHLLPALLLLICLGSASAPRIAAVHGLTLDEARAALAPNGPPEAVADRCDRLFREARTGRVRVQLEDKPEPVEMSLWEVVETDPRWRVLGDLWGRYGRVDQP